MSRAVAATLVLAATVLLAPAPVSAQPAPAPGELWSEFPLQPLVETVPTSTGSAPAVEEPVKGENSAVRKDDDRTAGFLILVGAALAAGVGFVGRRRVGKRRHSGEGGESPPEPAAVRPFERPVPAASSKRSAGAVAVASRPRTSATTLVETLSPQARLAERQEDTESEAEAETHQVCEIACWRGYVTWQFYVESESARVGKLVSPFFRAPGKGVPEQTDVALHAHAVLVEELVAAGWEPEGYGEEWYSERFQRPSV
jgi:hypothetical protein